LAERGVECEAVNKVLEGSPHILDRLKNGDVAMVINTPAGKDSTQDSYSIRRTALEYRLPYFTTLAAAIAAVNGIEALMKKGFVPLSLQAYHAQGLGQGRTRQSSSAKAG
jgi:carbamoyl-phosphate synthase large subunit